MPELPIQSLQFAHWKTRQRQSENQSTDHRSTDIRRSMA